MKHYTYLIVGGGMTADAAVRGIRQNDADGSIGMLSNEKYPPYNRPPLTKGLWKGSSIEKIWRGTQQRDVDLLLGTTATELNRAQKWVTDQAGEQYHYEFLLLATGGRPRKLPIENENMIYYRYLEDYYRLQEMTQSKHAFSVIGGSFIGSEIGAALAMNNKAVSMVFKEKGIGARNFPPDLSEFLTRYYRDRGVKVFPNAEIENVVNQENDQVIILRNGQQIRSEQVVAGIGIEANDRLAASAGLEVDRGIVVNEFLQTSDPSIYAAGDVASFYNPSLNKRIRVEHEDNANEMGLTAGQNMAGKRIPYTHLPYFYSDLFDLGYEAIGELDAGYELVEDWQEPFQKGVVYYLHAQRVRGVLLWNLWGKIDQARQLIAKPGPFSPEDVRGFIR